MNDVVSDINHSARRGAQWVAALAGALALAWTAFLVYLLSTGRGLDPLRIVLFVLIPLPVIGSFAHRARQLLRTEFTREGIRARATGRYTLHWRDVVGYEIEQQSLRLQLRDGRQHRIDLYAVNDADLVLQGVLSLVPEALHRRESA